MLEACNMTFENSVLLENWRSAVIIPLYKVKGERTEYKNSRSINLLRVVGKMYPRILSESL